LKRTNYPLWIAIAHVVSSKSLTIICHKVQAHAEDYCNNLTDSLAKAAATDLAPIPLDYLPFCHLPSLCYFDNILVEVDLNQFIKTLQQARLFEDYLRLARFSSIFIHYDRIDWPSTWNILKSSTFTHHLSTSFKDSKFRSYKFKLHFNELPTLERLKVRRPDLYDQDWTCFRCGHVFETLDHLWKCDFEVFHEIIELMRVETVLKTKKAYNTKHSNTDLTIPLLSDFEAACLALNCWKDNYADVNIFELVRGFIPTSLTSLINNVLRDIDLIHTIVQKIVTLLQTRLFKYV
jgi:hypothetical protein